MASKSKGPSEQSALKTTAQNATTAAGTVDPLQAAKAKHDEELFNWYTGKSGPTDVHNMPGGSVGIDLFNKAKQSNDAGRIGRGYGSLADGANPNFAAKLGQENDQARSLAASGALENYVTNTIAGNANAIQQDYSNRENHNFSYAGLTASNYDSYLKNRRPSFLKQMILGGMQTGGQLGSAAITAGMV